MRGAPYSHPLSRFVFLVLWLVLPWRVLVAQETSAEDLLTEDVVVEFEVDPARLNLPGDPVALGIELAPQAGDGGVEVEVLNLEDLGSVESILENLWAEERGVLDAVQSLKEAPQVLPLGGGFQGGQRNRGSMVLPFQSPEKKAKHLREQLEVVRDDEWEVISQRLIPLLKISRWPSDSLVNSSLRSFAFTRWTSSDDPLALAIKEGTLQQCLEALAARRKSQSEREGEIQRLRDALREVLSLRQEAILVVAGLLD
jgi:hypothetical protein